MSAIVMAYKKHELFLKLVEHYMKQYNLGLDHHSTLRTIIDAVERISPKIFPDYIFKEHIIEPVIGEHKTRFFFIHIVNFFMMFFNLPLFIVI